MHGTGQHTLAVLTPISCMHHRRLCACSPCEAGFYTWTNETSLIQMKPIGQVDWLVYEEAHPAECRPLPTTELNEINVVGFMALFYMHEHCLHDSQITHTLIFLLPPPDIFIR